LGGHAPPHPTGILSEGDFPYETVYGSHDAIRTVGDTVSDAIDGNIDLSQRVRKRFDLHLEICAWRLRFLVGHSLGDSRVHQNHLPIGRYTEGRHKGR